VAVGVVARFLPGSSRSEGERTAWRHGLVWTAVGLVASLGPTIVIFGWRVRLPLDDVVARLPFVNTLRDPLRIGVGALFGMSVLAGAAFEAYARWLDRPFRRAAIVRTVLAVVLVAASLHVRRPSVGTWPWTARYPIAPASPPANAVDALLGAPGGAILELPVDGPDVAPLTVHAQAMFRSIGTWRPLLNGYGGFYPRSFVDRMRLAARLPDRAALAELRAATGLELVVVRGAMPSTGSVARWRRLAEEGGGEGLALVATAGDDLLFAVSPSH
jgi:hypothetical protein